MLFIDIAVASIHPRRGPASGVPAEQSTGNPCPSGTGRQASLLRRASLPLSVHASDLPELQRLPWSLVFVSGHHQPHVVLAIIDSRGQRVGRARIAHFLEDVLSRFAVAKDTFR